MNEGKTDEELALEAKAGSVRSFEELTERYSPKLFHFLRPKIASDQDIEDIIQETFFKLYRNLFRYDPKWRFSTWIYTSVYRSAISHLRMKQKRQTVHLTSDPADGSHDHSISSSPHKNIWEKAKGLKPLYYEALWLRYVEDLSSKEMAKILKKSDMAVRLLLHRARLNLARKLQTIEGYAAGYSDSRAETSKLHIRENQQ